MPIKVAQMPSSWVIQDSNDTSTDKSEVDSCNVFPRVPSCSVLHDGIFYFIDTKIIKWTFRRTDIIFRGIDNMESGGNRMEITMKKIFEDNRVIPAVKDDEELKRALRTKHQVIFILYGDIMTMNDKIKMVIDAGKTPFIHVDMVDGLASNPVVLEYLFKHFKRECGIITTKSSIAKKAVEMKIKVVQRYFILDSLSVRSALDGINKVKVDAVEIMPGIIPSVIQKMSRQVSTPIIAGGLINTQEEVEMVMKAGAVCASTSRPELW